MGRRPVYVPWLSVKPEQDPEFLAAVGDLCRAVGPNGPAGSIDVSIAGRAEFRIASGALVRVGVVGLLVIILSRGRKWANVVNLN